MAAQAQKTEDRSTLKEPNEERVVAKPQNIEPEKRLCSWRAPARPFKRRDRQFWVRLLTIAGVFGFILFLIEGAMPVILIISLIFLFYILSTVEPEQIEYTITNKGVKISDQRTDFGLINRFWFAKRFDEDVLILETVNISGRLELVVGKGDKESIRKVLSEFLTEEKPLPSGLDKVSSWFSKRIQGS